MKFKIFLFVIILWQSLYPVYRNEIYGFTEVQLMRHKDVLEGKSIFYNPWQYRVFSAWVTEGLHRALDATVYNQNYLETSRYLTTFRLLRIIQHIIIFYLLYALLISFNINRWLAVLGISIATWCIGNATCASDYSFNTYFDIIFYLAAALLISKNKNYLWFIPLSIVAAFNRETAMLIPAMAFLNSIEVKGKISICNKRNFILSIISGILFLVIFFGLRMYYGYREQEVVVIAPGPEALWFNLSDLRSHIELFSVIGIFPFLTMVFYRRLPVLLKTWFWLIVPVWFGIHYYFAAIRESRLFLVPVMVVFIPAILYYVQGRVRESIIPPTP